MRYWKPEDIFSEPCPACGEPVEFFKDEMRLHCRSCKEPVANPRANLGCAQHCEAADQCVGPALAQKLRDEGKPGRK